MTLRTNGLGGTMRVPPAMQALVEVGRLNPQPGQSGTIDCPKCTQHTFNWWKERVIGKLSGACTSCGLRLPRA